MTLSATKKNKNHHLETNSVNDIEQTPITSTAAKLGMISWCGLLLTIRNLQNSMIVKDVLWAHLLGREASWGKLSLSLKYIHLMYHSWQNIN